MAAPGAAKQLDTGSVRHWHPATRELVGGVLAGAVNVVSGYPFDTMKVRLQASGAAYSGMTDCFLHIWKTEGVRGFFRGLSSPLLGGAAETGINYLVYSRVLDMFKPVLKMQQQQEHMQQLQWTSSMDQLLPPLAQAVTAQQHQLAQHVQLGQQLHHVRHPQQQQQQQQRLQQQRNQQHSDLPPLAAVPVAGAVAGVALSVILSPTELIKCRMQMAQHSSPLQCLKHVLQSEGYRGLARGFVPTLCREIPGNAIFFTVYEGLRRSWMGRPGNVGSHAGGGSSSSRLPPSVAGEGGALTGLEAAWQVVLDAGSAIVCGGIAGVVMWTSVLPLDVGKTRIQTAQPGSSWDTNLARQLMMMWREGGRHSLWAGLTPTVVRAFPANACQWLAWELAMRQLLPPAVPLASSEDGCEPRGHHQQLLSQGPAATAAAV